MDSGPRLRTARALVLLPLLLVLAGCVRLDMAVTIAADETVDLAVEVVDRTRTMTRDDLACADLSGQLGSAGLPEGVDYDVVDLEEDGNVGCGLSVTGAAVSEMTAEGMSITATDDRYTFVLEGDESLDAEEIRSMGLEFRLAVTFPGEVVDAGGGEVSGTTVTWTDPAVMATGATASGAAAPTSEERSPADDPTDDAGPAGAGAADDRAGDVGAEDDGGAGALPWLLGVLGAFVVAAVLLAVREARRRRP